MQNKRFVALAVVVLTIVAAQAGTNVVASNEIVSFAALPAGGAGLINSSINRPAVAASANKEEVVFFDDFSAYRKRETVGDYPESLLSELATQAASGEERPILGWEVLATMTHRHLFRQIQDGAYRITESGNEHCPIAPALKDFTLEFDAKVPDEGSKYATMFVDYRLGDHGERGYRLRYQWGCMEGKPTAWMGLFDYPNRLKWSRLDGEQKFKCEVMTNVLDWQKFRVEVQGNTVRFFHNGHLQGAMSDPRNRYPEAGRIGFDFPDDNDNDPGIMLDNVRISAAGVPVKTVYERTIQPYKEFPFRLNAFINSAYHVRLRQVGDVYELYTRLSSSTNASWAAPTETNIAKAEKSVLVNPYVRIEDADGSAAWPVVIFPGKIGSNYRVKTGALGLNDHMGPVERTTYLRNLPAKWRLYVGYDYYLLMSYDSMAGGPSEALIDPASGNLLYLGGAMRDGLAMQVESPADKQIIKRVTRAYSTAILTRFLSENHCFAPDEPVRFRADVYATDRCPAEGLSARFEVLDAFFQPLGERQELPLDVASSLPAESLPKFDEYNKKWGILLATSNRVDALRNLGVAFLSTGFQKFASRAPGVYHIRLTLLWGQEPVKELTRAFEIVPPMGSDKTPAELSGLPDLTGALGVNLDLYQYDAIHYASTWGMPLSDRSQDWLELANALCRHIWINGLDFTNQQAIVKNADFIRAAAGIVNPKYNSVNNLYHWRDNIYSRPVVQQLLRDYLADPATPKPAGSELAKLVGKSDGASVQALYMDIRKYHWRPWIDYMNLREGEKVRDFRASIQKINPKCRIWRYGHPMPCGNDYIGLDFCRVGGKDYVADNITEDEVFFEGYITDHRHSIERTMVTMALMKMVCPRLTIRLDNEGDMPCVEDGQNARAWAPYGVPVLRRGFQKKSMLLQGLSTVYFDGQRFHRAWDNMYSVTSFVPERWRELIEAARVIRQVAPLDRPVATVAFAWSWDAIRAYDFLWWGDPGDRQHAYNPADENLVFTGEEVPRAGVVGGFVCRLDDIENLPACDTLVLPPLKGVKPALIEAIRKKHSQGVHLVGFQDVSGLEDLFGIESIKDGETIDSLAPADNPLAKKLTAGIPERQVRYWGSCNRAGYRVKEATAVLDARDESGRVIGPALVVMKSGKQAANAFWAVPPTDVWRESCPTGNNGGETMSRLVKHLMGRVVREIATPPVTTSAGEVLAHWGTDGKLYVLSYENAYPQPSAPLIRPVVSISLPGIDKADVQCEKAFEIVERSPGKLSLMTSLEPEAFALYVISPKRGLTKKQSKWTNIFGSSKELEQDAFGK